MSLLLLLAISCSGRGKVDLSKAKPLSPEPVSGNGPNGTVTEGSTQFNSLFSYQPGDVVSRKVGSVIDATGTSLSTDYDGDGLTNEMERASSQWVSDYPRIEASVSTPVTMTIDIEKSLVRDNDTITSDITSDDFEDNRDKGTENVHRNEVGVRTTQIQEKYSGSSESSGSVTTGSGSGFDASVPIPTPIGVFGVSGGGKSSSSSGSSWGKSNSFSETKTTFPDAPATNNLDRDGWSVKANSAAKNARKYRADKTGKVGLGSVVRPNAGHVRAALYIKNFSVNMPVRLTNILCTLMFETPTGQLIPMQSFRLRNDDFSLFTLNLYGASEFGPYVIDLPNLNTNEVESAIRLGYNPKIFIVDYDISHVPNSNYKAVLPGAIGDNVKIVEENAKGRTALVKIKGPGVREMYRVAAWEFDQAGDTCAANSTGAFRPGVSLENVLKRLNCMSSARPLDGIGIDFESGDYVIDLSDVLPNLPAGGGVVVHGVKRLAGIDSKIPCTAETKTGSDGITRSVCRMKKISEFNADDNRDFGMWVVFANGKYYSHSEYVKTSGVDVRYDGTNNQSEKVLRGISSIVWAGDNYDFVYISLQELIALQNRFGTNPLETNALLNIGTKWDSSKVGSLDSKYQPDKFSVFLGKAAKGDHVELTFKLNSNKQLQYNFGSNSAANGSGVSTYKDFDYSINTLSNRFGLLDAVKFELNLGLGGNKGDWYDITKVRNLTEPTDTGLEPCHDDKATLDASIDFVGQTFTLCFIVPGTAYDYSASGIPTLVNLYLRPKLLDEYRNVIWPEKLPEVKKFKGEINADTTATPPTTVIQLRNVAGAIEVNDTLKIGSKANVYTVSQVVAETSNPKLLNLTISPALANAHKQGEVVKADSAALTSPLVKVNITDNYFSSWNSYVSALTGFSGCNGACTFNTDFAATGGGLFGLNYNQSNLNWVGRDLFAYDLYDYGKLDASKYEQLFGMDLENLISVPGANPIQKLWLKPQASIFSAMAQDNLQISNSNTGTQIQHSVSSSGAQTIVVWSSNETGSNNTVRARIYDLQSGQPAGPDFRVNSSTYYAPDPLLPQVSAGGDRALVAWKDQYGYVFARVIDLSSGNPIGNDIEVTPYEPNMSVAGSPQVAVQGNSGVIVWAGLSNSTYRVGYFGRRIDLAQGNISGSLIALSSENNYYGGTHSVTIANEKVILIWSTRDASESQYNPVFMSAVFDLNQNIRLSSDQVIGLGNPNNVYGAPGGKADIVGSQNRAIVTWPVFGDGNLLRTMARAIDLDSGLFASNAVEVSDPVYSVSPFSNAVQVPVKIINVNGKALVFWAYSQTNPTTKHGIKARFLNFNDASPLGESVFTPDNGKQFSLTGAVASSDGVAVSFLVYDPASNTQTVAIQALDATTLDSAGGVVSVDFPGGITQAPLLAAWGKKAILIWGASAQGFTNPDIVGRFFELKPYMKYGLNNFFTAPLIERNYTVTAKLR